MRGFVCDPLPPPREGTKLVLNRVLALRKVYQKRKRGFASAHSRGNKEGIAKARSSAVAVALGGRGGESLFR